VLIAGVLLAALYVIWRTVRPGLTEEELDSAILVTLTREAEASFLVTGTLEFGTQVERENRQILALPLAPFDLQIGATRVAVRLPGRAAYGFDIREIGAEDIRLADDGVVEIDLPELTTFSVEPILERAEVRTDASGWARLDAERGSRVTRNALASARRRMREQADRHIAESPSPRLNAARAVVRMVAPSLRAAGVERPRFRVTVGVGEVLELDPSALEVTPG
jgi:hypothetical protein